MSVHGAARPFVIPAAIFVGAYLVNKTVVPEAETVPAASPPSKMKRLRQSTPHASPMRSTRLTLFAMRSLAPV